MYDIVGKIWAFIFGVMILFLGTITIYAQKQDTVIQNYVDSAVEEFVDVSRASGQISTPQYEAFIQKLDNTGTVYDINIIHYKEKTAPVAEQDDYQTYYETYDRMDILNYLKAHDEDEKPYQMNVGDFLRVTVKNSKPTLGRKMMGFFLGRPSDEGGQIISSYGGYIGND